MFFFGFFETVQHFCKKKIGFLGQYSVFVNCLLDVRRDADAQLMLMMLNGHVARLSLEAFRKPHTLNPNPRPWKSKVGMPSRTSRT